MRFFAISRELKGILQSGHWGRGDPRSFGRRFAALVRKGWYLGEDAG